jgi:hypothetical protein
MNFHRPCGTHLRVAAPCFIFLVLCVAATRTSAATLADYRRRVSEAAASIEQLQSTYDDEDPFQREQFVAATIARVRDQLPEKETVLLERQSVAVDNAWLHEALRDYEKIRGDGARSAELLARVDERLRALGERLEEISKGAGAANKDESKGKLAEILRRPEYHKNAAEGSALERLWLRFLRWLSSLFPKSKPLQPGSARALSGIAQVLVIAVCFAGIVFLIWKFVPRYLRNRRQKKPQREARIVLGERLEPDQTSADLLAQAESLARSGDLRAAIRKAYIALLCELGDRKIISLAQHKTNRDYLHSVRESASLYASMRRLTNSFELHWYGFVPAGPDDWADFRAGYLKAVTRDK